MISDIPEAQQQKNDRIIVWTLIFLTLLGLAFRLYLAWRTNQTLPDTPARLSGDEPGYEGILVAEGAFFRVARPDTSLSLFCGWMLCNFWSFSRISSLRTSFFGCDNHTANFYPGATFYWPSKFLSSGWINCAASLPHSSCQAGANNCLQKVVFFWLGNPISDWPGHAMFNVEAMRPFFSPQRIVGIFASRIFPVFAALGMIVLRHRWREFLPLLVVCGYFTFIHALTYAEVRYSEILHPILAVVIATAAGTLQRRLKLISQ